MSPGFLRSGMCLIVAGLALSGWRSVEAQQSPSRRGRAIEFSEPKNEIVTSNLNQTLTKQTLRSLDQDLKQPFEIFNSGDSLGGIRSVPMPRIQQPTLKSKRAKELLDKKKNAFLYTPEELYGPQTPEDMMNVPQYGPNGEELKNKTPMERYYDRLDKVRGGNTNVAGGNGVYGSRKNRDGEEDLSALSSDKGARNAGWDESESATTRQAAKKEAANDFKPEQPAPAKSFSEFFGFGGNDSPDRPVEKNPIFESRTADFKQLLESRSPSSTTFSPGVAGSAFAPAASPGFSSAFSPPSAAPRATFNSLPTPSASPAFGLQSLPTAPSVPSFTPGFSQPAAPTPPRYTMPVATFELPKRKF